MTASLIGIALAAGLSAPQVLPIAGLPTPIAPDVPAYRVAAPTQVGRVADRMDDVGAMLAMLNVRRASRGLAPLTLDPTLTTVAYGHAADMVQRSYFSHVSPDGVSPFERMDRAGCTYGYAGENLALDQDGKNAELALWQSPEHRNNILQPHYVKVGIAAVRTQDGEIFVEDFSD